MVDTPRTLAQLANIFRDGQSESSISEQDQRDMIVTLGQVPFGGIHITLPNIETNISTINTYVKLAGNSEIIANRNMDMPENGRLRYIGIVPYHFRIATSSSVIATGSNKVFGFQFFIFDDSASSGALIVESQINRKMGAAGDEGSISLHWDVIMEPNDYVELWVENRTDNTNVTIDHLYLSAVGHPI